MVRRGSSPLARGLRFCVLFVRLFDGIIPARAGFTRGLQVPVHRRGDHPRSRGVYEIGGRRGASPRGSSPLARGLRDLLHQDPAGPRIIPARAGFTTVQSSYLFTAADHPRSRGVYRLTTTGRSAARGSSPLARGLLPPMRQPRIRRRIIPARAGFTRTRRWIAGPRPDHPRSRGVYQNEEVDRWAKTGSSPLARGLLDGQELGEGEVRIIPARAGLPHGWGLRQCCARIIPARAGFTTRADGPRRASGDHPRSRGVYSRVLAGCPDDRGSSPLARGLPVPGVGLLPGGGIIPARAGFTITHPLGRYIPEDHPRSRGVYMRRRRSSSTAAGSSPLARGLPVQ